MHQNEHHQAAPHQVTGSGDASPAPGRLQTAAKDWIDGFASTQLWMTFGWTDILQRYRRSLLGPFWITLSAGAMIGGIGLLYSQLLKQPTADYLPFLAAGLITWFFISAVINEGCSVFIGAEHMIKQVRLPFTVHVLRVVFRNLVILLHNLLVLVPVYLWSGKAVGWGVLLALPAILLLALNGVLLALALGIVCARFRDVPPIVQNLVQLGFFLTPIMFHERNLGDMGWVAQINPFFHFLEIVRAPLLGEVAPLDSWMYVLAATAALTVASLGFFARYRARIPYWI
ncbi:MAG: ABC transporter permease [Burkholderiales bacterium]|jgi:ABC-type polysaccharide/polyol phosphate export permease|nr:ABC transporter permease [Burkholderiales bacterium]